MLSDENLDRKIAQLNQSVDAALADHKTAERSAVEDAWALGQHLVEKKKRLEHGEFLPWLATTGIADSTANEFMMLARQITSVGDLGVSIRSSIRGLKPPPQPAADAGPVEPETEDIEDVKAALVEADERIGLMADGADPASRATVDKLNNQAELIRTLKASVANKQAKNTDLLAQLKACRRRNKALEAAAAKVVPTGGKHGA